MKMQNITIIANSNKGINLSLEIKKELNTANIYSTREHTSINKTASIQHCLQATFNTTDAIVFIGAMGICVRSIAPFLKDKKTDPAIINIDANGHYIQSVVSGHVGGANDLAKQLARIVGGIPLISTTSDADNLWPLDTLHQKFNWTTDVYGDLNKIIGTFINGGKTALLLEIRDAGTRFLERTAPENVTIFYNKDEIQPTDHELILAVTFKEFTTPLPSIFFRPKVLHLGMGCRKGVDPDLAIASVKKHMTQEKLSLKSIKTLGSIDIKKDEKALLSLAETFNIPFNTYPAEVLSEIDIPNPSEKVKKVTGTWGVSESVAIKQSNNSALVMEKTSLAPAKGHEMTMSIALEVTNERKGMVYFVGAGPGDPELISVKGKELLQVADLVLYAGSLVPQELTHYAPTGAVVKSSASLNLTEQVEIMKAHYTKGHLIVRLHTGDPCIYGAIQEQMALMDQLQMTYDIVPGISSFQAAAARLKSQFTIPEKTQTIILTRGEGRTPMPDKEQLEKLARSQSTMCIFLSATLATKVQDQLLAHYPQNTPVAVCYKLTWKEEKIWRCTLSNLAKTIKDNNLTLTTLIVVGEAIDNRQGLSKLYHKEFKHLYR